MLKHYFIYFGSLDIFIIFNHYLGTILMWEINIHFLYNINIGQFSKEGEFILLFNWLYFGIGIRIKIGIIQFLKYFFKDVNFKFFLGRILYLCWIYHTFHSIYNTFHSSKWFININYLNWFIWNFWLLIFIFQ